MVRPKLPVVQIFARHGRTSNTAKSGITLKGRRQAQALGLSLPAGRKFKFYSSKTRKWFNPVGLPESKRALNTSHAAKRSREALGKPTYAAPVRGRRVYGDDFILKNGVLFDKLREKKGTKQLIRDWLDDKPYLRKAMVNAETVADRIISERLGFGRRLAKISNRNIGLLEVFHSFYLEAVFERLTGERFDKQGNGEPSDNTEKMVFEHAQGKTVLVWRNKRWNITKRLKEILSAQKQKRKQR